MFIDDAIEELLIIRMNCGNIPMEVAVDNAHATCESDSLIEQSATLIKVKYDPTRVVVFGPVTHAKR